MTMASGCTNGEAMSADAPLSNHEQSMQKSPIKTPGNNSSTVSSLCVKCNGLGLEPDCFIVRSYASGLPNPTNFRMRSTATPSVFGTLKEIALASGNCSLCRLVFNSVQQEKGGSLSGTIEAGNELESATCTWNWEVDGRKIYEFQDHDTDQRGDLQSPRGLTRRIHIRWSHIDLRDSYLVYAAPETLQTASDADNVWNPSRLFLGRQIGESGKIQARVKSWIDLCQNRHRGPCSLQPGYLRERFCRMLSHAYFGVIDVLNMQLTELPMGDSLDPAFTFPVYVALSYVWGDAPSYKTTLDKIMQHRMHGGLDRVLRDLPKVVQDSIDLVRRLGMQYLWVDALCIVQDSARSWSLNAYNMDLIYGCAAFTICAADGSSASTGLLAMNENTGTGRKSQDIASCTPDIRLIVSRPPAMFIRSSKWNTRAWTFQERLLSRRCLIFTGNRVFFQCHSTGMSEDIYADREGAGWSLDFMDAPLQIFRQVSTRSIWVYMRSVELYTARDLSKPGDILAAFSGVSNLLHRTMCAPFIFGLPSSHFDASILWSYPGSVERRFLGVQSSKSKATEFPSWSWSGWSGGSVEHRREMISDCTDNMHEWLKKRTWIRWYIRDSNGDLRPLWHPDKWSLDRSEHVKWQGYSKSRSSGSARFRGPSSRRKPETYMSKACPTSDDSSTFNLSDTTSDPRYHSTLGTHGALHRTQAGNHATKNRSRRRRPRSPESSVESLDHQSLNEYQGTPSFSSLNSQSSWRLVNVGDQRQDRHRNSLLSINGDDRLDSSEEVYRRPTSNDRSGTVRPSTANTSDFYLRIFREWVEEVACCNEIMRFLVDVILVVLRLIKCLLGFPTELKPPPVRRSLAIDLSDPENDDPSTKGHDGSVFPKNAQISERIPDRLSHFLTSRAEERARSPPTFSRTGGGALRRHRPAQSELRHDRNTHADNIVTQGRSRRRAVRFNTYRHPPKSPATDPFAVGYNRDLTSPAMSRILRVLRGPPPVPTPVLASGLDDVTAAKRRQHDLIYHTDSQVEPEHTESEPHFRITLKDFPYQPAITSLGSGDIKATLLPILQFWTWHTSLFIQTNSLSASGNARCNIADSFGDWCGSIMLDARWLRSTKAAKQEFIALSEAKKFSDEECNTWSYYIPKEREESEWDLFYVMLIEWTDGKWERVGLGKVFKEAFRDAIWKEIVLA
ncbi:heterokaryon incompatibility protein-domain-containing protein [Phaeosphaeria sp. MPI-PUGE-AT-0046c]|nr:heterokaryon incompatibility protein-domain-containing protein [Phaeosphaeria sp. MPI-PUGE-AT-0046c]